MKYIAIFITDNNQFARVSSCPLTEEPQSKLSERKGKDWARKHPFPIFILNWFNNSNCIDFICTVVWIEMSLFNPTTTIKFSCIGSFIFPSFVGKNLSNACSTNLDSDGS